MILPIEIEKYIMNKILAEIEYHLYDNYLCGDSFYQFHDACYLLETSIRRKKRFHYDPKMSLEDETKLGSSRHDFFMKKFKIIKSKFIKQLIKELKGAN